MLSIGIVGLGFMGKAHFDVYQTMGGKAAATAIVEPDTRKRAGDLSGVTGNVGDVSSKPDFSRVRMYAKLADMLADGAVDVVDVTVPSFLHKEMVLASLAAGKHVICEKPLALNHADALEMAAAARRAGRFLFPAHCVRFWPAYRRAYEIVRSGEYGAVRTARFIRLSFAPNWNWDSWVLDAARSGGAPLDFHIHDSDFVLHLFGMPKAVTSHGGGRRTDGGNIDHIATAYHYGDDRLILAEGGWEYSAGFPFSMTFAIHMERTTLHLEPDGKLRLCRDGLAPEILPVEPGDGWRHELNHFVDCILAGRESGTITAGDAADSIKLVLAEVESVRTGRRVELA